MDLVNLQGQSDHIADPVARLTHTVPGKVRTVLELAMVIGLPAELLDAV